jgi:beta-phosphoglucomutase
MSEKAIIFDLDGVIVDTAKYHYLAWKALANGLNFDFTPEQNELLKGVSRVRSLDILLDIGKIHLEEDQKQLLLVEKNEEYLQYISQMDHKEILPGIDDLLHFLKLNKIPFALGSASKNARLILEKLNLLHLFQAIVDGNDVSTAKPDPEVFLIAARKLGKDPEACIVIEDAKAGIEAANRAHMTSVGIGEKRILKDANFVLNSTSELTIDFVHKLIA